MKLDARTVAGLREPPPGKADTIYFCDELPGFGLRVRKGGHRVWVAQYRVHGLTRRVTIGSAERLGPSEAREAARKVLARVVLGEDPAADRRRGREQAKLTLRALADEYLRSREGKVRPRTLAEVRRYLTSPAYFGPLHAVPVDLVDRKAVAARIMHVERESGSVTAARARSALSALFSWGMQTGLAENNATIGCYAPDHAAPRDRVLSDDELVHIWRACEDDDFGRIVRLLILTGCRRQEVGGMCWSELDRDRGVWTLPAERAKNGRQQVLPLPALAWAIIDSIPRRIERDNVFGDRAATGFTIWKAKVELDARLAGARSAARGSVADWTLHDLRRSTATKMADLGVQPHIIEETLNHRSGHRRGVASVYNHSTYEREVRAALALWSDYVRTLVEGGERTIVFPQGSTRA